ncbi:hypothetical protein T440DRAFT_507938 [Plenodomus tracheiphilus IPT5]|uniref:Uncharacterized protein n=1 Tax=Plenodomus tracheiphilus IPT5 TaxID=1408161 RepID=A0A6A7B547_9PLEO|nr:hypothetical protein T440DRAFT_507938 [Plenodomus tracheiphilus IPT5]
MADTPDPGSTTPALKETTPFKHALFTFEHQSNKDGDGGLMPHLRSVSHVRSEERLLRSKKSALAYEERRNDGTEKPAVGNADLKNEFGVVDDAGVGDGDEGQDQEVEEKEEEDGLGDDGNDHDRMGTASSVSIRSFHGAGVVNVGVSKTSLGLRTNGNGVGKSSPSTKRKHATTIATPESPSSPYNNTNISTENTPPSLLLPHPRPHSPLPIALDLTPLNPSSLDLTFPSFPPQPQQSSTPPPKCPSPHLILPNTPTRLGPSSADIQDFLIRRDAADEEERVREAKRRGWGGLKAARAESVRLVREGSGKGRKSLDAVVHRFNWGRGGKDDKGKEGKDDDGKSKKGGKETGKGKEDEERGFFVAGRDDDEQAEPSNRDDDDTQSRNRQQQQSPTQPYPTYFLHTDPHEDSNDNTRWFEPIEPFYPHHPPPSSTTTTTTTSSATTSSSLNINTPLLPISTNTPCTHSLSNISLLLRRKLRLWFLYRGTTRSQRSSNNSNRRRYLKLGGWVGSRGRRSESGVARKKWGVGVRFRWRRKGAARGIMGRRDSGRG